jgi:hypothetical protein
VRSAVLSLSCLCLLTIQLLAQRGPAAYTVVMPDGKRISLPYRTTGSVDLVPLDQIAAAFARPFC